MADTTDLKSVAERHKGSTPFTPKNYMVQLCIKSTHPKHKHAALIFHHENLIAHANNNGNEHAEIRALQVAKIMGYTKDLILLSIRVTKIGKLTMAKPCIGCLFYIKEGIPGRVSKILYSNEKGRIVKL